ncbi:hypothetical protein MTO96_003646 [Rhipicephalus appendiculatus]
MHRATVCSLGKREYGVCACQCFLPAGRVQRQVTVTGPGPRSRRQLSQERRQSARYTDLERVAAPQQAQPPLTTLAGRLEQRRMEQAYRGNPLATGQMTVIWGCSQVADAWKFG